LGHAAEEGVGYDWWRKDMWLVAIGGRKGLHVVKPKPSGVMGSAGWMNLLSPIGCDTLLGGEASSHGSSKRGPHGLTDQSPTAGRCGRRETPLLTGG